MTLCVVIAHDFTPLILGCVHTGGFVKLQEVLGEFSCILDSSAVIPLQYRT